MSILEGNSTVISQLIVPIYPTNSVEKPSGSPSETPLIDPHPHLSPPQKPSETLPETPDTTPFSSLKIPWHCKEISAFLQNVEAHVAPTDVDPMAPPQWKKWGKVREFVGKDQNLKGGRLGGGEERRRRSLLELVFHPSDMYFRYGESKPRMGIMVEGNGENFLEKEMREKSFTLRPLTEISLNSAQISASLSSMQFQTVLDVISNLVLARIPK